MNSRAIINFEKEIKEKLNLDIEYDTNNDTHTVYLITDLEKYNLNPLQYGTKQQIFSFFTVTHPNCGMGILQSLYFYERKEIKIETIKQIFFSLLRKLYPISSNKHIFFTFQNENYNEILKQLDFSPICNYINYNHSSSKDRTIWMLDIKNFKGVETITEKCKTEEPQKVKRPVGRPRKKSIPVADEITMAM